MRLQKANFFALLFTVFLPLVLGGFFHSYSFFSIDREENAQKIYEAKEKLQQEVFHKGLEVEKDFWMTDEKAFVNIRIESPSSEMRLEKIGSCYEIIETLSPARFHFQDKGELRIVDARLCHLSYHQHTIKAFDLSMHFYEKSAPTEQDSPYLSASAEEAFFACKENPYTFQAKNLLANFSSGYRLQCDGSLFFDPEKNYLIADKNKEPIQFHHDRLSIESSSLLIEYKDHTPYKISFKNDVLMKNGDMYGTAAQIDYFPKESRLELLSFPESYVLFYHQKQDRKIKAKTVIIERDSLTHEDSVRGVGKVEISIEEKDFLNLFTHIEKCTNNLY